MCARYEACFITKDTWHVRWKFCNTFSQHLIFGSSQRNGKTILTSNISLFSLFLLRNKLLFTCHSLVLETFTFLHYANEESDDIINCSTKTIIKNTDLRVSPEILEQWSSNLAPEIYITKETNWHLLYCCHGNTLGSSLSLKNQISPFATFLSGTGSLPGNRQLVPTLS